MRQQTLAAQTGFEKYGRKSKRERFLDEMEQVVPWAELQALVEPHYPKGENGRPPVGLSIMLRVYFVQQWFNLSDPGAEEALYESPALRQFAGVDLGRAPAPDESTILQFRHLREKHDLGGATLNAVNQYLESRGGGASPRVQSSMRPLFMRLRRPRTGAESAIRRCTKRARGSSGTSD
jgi:transposase, IS5 family